VIDEAMSKLKVQMKSKIQMAPTKEF
jgi:hypothetical protein